MQLVNNIWRRYYCNCRWPFDIYWLKSFHFFHKYIIIYNVLNSFEHKITFLWNVFIYIFAIAKWTVSYYNYLRCIGGGRKLISWDKRANWDREGLPGEQFRNETEGKKSSRLSWRHVASWLNEWNQELPFSPSRQDRLFLHLAFSMGK